MQQEGRCQGIRRSAIRKIIGCCDPAKPDARVPEWRLLPKPGFAVSPHGRNPGVSALLCSGRPESPSVGSPSRAIVSVAPCSKIVTAFILVPLVNWLNGIRTLGIALFAAFNSHGLSHRRTFRVNRDGHSSGFRSA